MSLIVGKGVEGRWSAAFAWSAERGGPGLTVRRFRRCFGLERVPERFLVYGSADKTVGGYDRMQILENINKRVKRFFRTYPKVKNKRAR